jgi:hypothetical protein
MLLFSSARDSERAPDLDGVSLARYFEGAQTKLCFKVAF